MRRNGVWQLANLKTVSTRSSFLPRLAALLLLPLTCAAASLSSEIDRHIAQKAGGTLAPLASDGEFLRRAWLDFTGGIPTPAETRAFLADKNPQKRAQLIERLLASPQFPQRMEDAITVMLLERRSGGKVPEAKWREWLRAQFAANRPWNALVHDLILLEGDPKVTPAAKFLADAEKFDQEKATHDIARLFLGMNLGCAQCHDHPTVDDFTQGSFYGIYAFLAQSSLKEDKVAKVTLLAEGVATNRVEFKSVFRKTNEVTGPRLPGGKEIPVPTFPKGEEYEVMPAKNGNPGVPKFRSRPLLAKELASEANERFAQTSVNRFWFQLMGRGLVHPLDMMHKENPPSHPELLDQLAREFIAHKFDVKWLLREIALSETYQRASRAPKGTDLPQLKPESYRIANLKFLSAEQVARATMLATGAADWLPKTPGETPTPATPAAADDTEEDGGKPTKGFNVKAYLNGKLKQPPGNAVDALALFVATFANPPGEPEVEFAPSMSHSLFLMNERLVLDWLKPRDNNLTARLAKLKTPAAIADELYLTVLTRPPEPAEITEVESYLAKHTSRPEAALAELAWALLASAEFRLNH